MKVVAYYRVSTEIQDYHYQQTVIDNYCKPRDYEIVKTFSEKSSGFNKVRLALSELMEYVLDCNDIDYVIVTEISRLGRTYEVLKTID